MHSGPAVRQSRRDASNHAPPQHLPSKKTFTPPYGIRHPSPKAHKKQPPHPAFPRIVMASVHGKKGTSMTALLPWKVQANSQARHPVPRRSTSPAVRGTPSFNSRIPAHTFTGGDARRDPTGKALADTDRDRRRFFFDFQGTTLPSEAFSRRCIPRTEQAPVHR